MQNLAADAGAIASALGRVVNSRVFAESPRLRTFLEFFVARSLRGADGDLKESVIAIEVFGKPHGFDPRLDATVRVSANRLRAKLRSYYKGEGADDPILIELPEGHYIPRYSVQRRAAARRESGRRRRRFDGRAFVGREAELELLQSHLTRAAAGHGHMLCVAAEAGMGKTALIEAFLAKAGEEDLFASAVGRCRQELERTESYLPWLEILEDLVSADASAGELLQTAAPTWWGHLHFEPSRAHVQQASSVKREMHRFLGALAERRPLVLVLEDLHWADTSSVDLIGYLGAALPSLRVLLLASYRASDLVLTGSSFLKVEPELKMHRVCEDLPLAGLGLADTERYLDLRFPDHAFCGGLAQYLQARSEGNALCLTAMVDHALERGWIAFQGGRWGVAAPHERWDAELSPSVSSMVGVKLAALARPDYELLAAAAVQGTEFDAAVVARAEP